MQELFSERGMAIPPTTEAVGFLAKSIMKDSAGKKISVGDTLVSSKAIENSEEIKVFKIKEDYVIFVRKLNNTLFAMTQPDLTASYWVKKK